MFNMSYKEAEKRLDGRDWRRYKFAWQWSAFRFASLLNPQEACTRRWGFAKTLARINKVRKILGLEPYPNSWIELG